MIAKSKIKEIFTKKKQLTLFILIIILAIPYLPTIANPDVLQRIDSEITSVSIETWGEILPEKSFDIQLLQDSQYDEIAAISIAEWGLGEVFASITVEFQLRNWENLVTTNQLQYIELQFTLAPYGRHGNFTTRGSDFLGSLSNRFLICQNGHPTSTVVNSSNDISYLDLFKCNHIIDNGLVGSINNKRNYNATVNAYEQPNENGKVVISFQAYGYSNSVGSIAAANIVLTELHAWFIFSTEDDYYPYGKASMNISNILDNFFYKFLITLFITISIGGVSMIFIYLLIKRRK